MTTDQPSEFAAADPAEAALRLIAKITSAISFPAGDAEFDAALDDCIAALEGTPSPAEDRALAERALRALLDQTDRLGLPVPEKLRAEALALLDPFQRAVIGDIDEPRQK